MQKILLATDGSTFSEDAAWFLAHLPHDKQLDVVVVTVVNIPSSNRSTLSRDWIDQCTKEEHQRAAENFAAIESMFEGANVNLRHVVQHGHVGSKITMTAEQEQVELVVIGATGRSAVSRMLLGSVSDYVATHAPCSVLVVRPGMRNARRPLQLVIAYEATESGDAGLREISEIQWGTEPELRVVSVAKKMSADDDGDLQYVMNRVARAADRIRSIAPAALAQVLESEHVGESLVSYTEVHQSDIIVVAESPRTNLGRFLLGSVSRFVLRHAPCSVWVTRNRITAEAASNA
jgi:nucleotide-binding universal stress UspA family protein